MPTWSRSEATRRRTGVRRKNPLLSAKTKSRSQGLLFALAKINKGIRTRREQTCLRKKTVRWTVFADVVKERSDAKVHGSAPKKSLAIRHKAPRNFDRITAGFFYARKPLEIKTFAVFEHKRTPSQSVSAMGFCAFYGCFGMISLYNC